MRVLVVAAAVEPLWRTREAAERSAASGGSAGECTVTPHFDERELSTELRPR